MCRFLERLRPVEASGDMDLIVYSESDLRLTHVGVLVEVQEGYYWRKEGAVRSYPGETRAVEPLRMRRRMGVDQMGLRKVLEALGVVLEWLVDQVDHEGTQCGIRRLEEAKGSLVGNHRIVVVREELI